MTLRLRMDIPGVTLFNDLQCLSEEVVQEFILLLGGGRRRHTGGSEKLEKRAGNDVAARPGIGAFVSLRRGGRRLR